MPPMATPNRTNKIKKEYGVTVVTSPSQKVKTPEHVDPDRRHVFMDDYCETPMRYLGTTDTGMNLAVTPSPMNVFGLPFVPNAEKYPSIPVNLANFRIFSRKSTRSGGCASIWKDRIICSSIALA